LSLVGAVDSTFDPPLRPHTFVQPQHGGCGVVIAGEALCDPRAQCSVAQLGGVKCACTGKGLQDADSSLTDGRRCMQDAQMRILVQSESVTLRLQKPSTSESGHRIQVLLQAEGEHALRVGYSMCATRTSAVDGAVMAPVANASKAWEQLDNTTYSFYGLHIVWDRPPSADAQLDLNANAARFAAAKAFVLDFAVDCYGAQPCAQDGDLLVLSVVARSDSTDLSSGLTITTVVEALLSCYHSRLWVELDVVPISTPIRVQVSANDADNLPLTFTRAEISLAFGGRRIPMQWSRGSNEYVADVPAELTSQPGAYDLVVNASNAWNGTGPATSCELLRRTIIVKEGLSTVWLLVGASTTALLLISVLVVLVRRKRKQLQAVLTMLFTEAGQLVFSICMALANVITDGIVCSQMLRGELTVSSDVYKAAYVTILCFGVVATAVSILYRIRNARLVHAQLQQLAPQAVASSEARRQSQEQNWELTQTHRTKVALTLSLMTVTAQGAIAA
jgi:hypothetical protein